VEIKEKYGILGFGTILPNHTILKNRGTTIKLIINVINVTEAL